MRLQPFTDYCAYLVFRCVICAIQATSLESCDRLAILMGRLFANYLPFRKSLIDANLQRVFPHWEQYQISETRSAMWHHLILMVCEIAHAPRKIRRSNWHQHFTIVDRRGLLSHVLDSRPKILVSGHFGNFELAGFLTGLFGIPSTTIARPLDNPFVHRYVTAFRSLGGQHFLPKDGSSVEVQSLLNRGGTLALLADQDAGNRGCWVEFLGHPASCHKALALFTLTSGAPMTVVETKRMHRPLCFQMTLCGHADPLVPSHDWDSVQSLTAWYNRCLETSIRKTPHQYWWVHRRWREPPPRLRKASLPRAAA